MRKKNGLAAEENKTNRSRFAKGKKFWLTAGLSVLLLSLLTLGFTDDKRNFSIVKNLDIFYTLFRELNSYYVDETNPEKLIRTGIDSMLESLDPYTQYIPESDLEDFKFMTTGEYAGIGSLISKKGHYVVISEPYEGFPAQKAGLKAGDMVLEIDGADMTDKNTPDVSEKLKGPANTKVKIKVKRTEEKKPLVFEIVREKIQINPVAYYGMVDLQTGLIVLNNFTTNCSEEVKKAFLDLRDTYKAKNVVLDLRSNPGGLLDEAIKIVNLFVPRGSEIVSTRGKVKQWDKVYKATSLPIDTVMSLSVLINRGSASASEIVAGSLQDLDRAVIVGQRSFGKGLVQTTRGLSYNSQLKVTTAKYYIPSGRCIQAIDYSHRNDDGSVGYVPDSLITEYKTKNGRPVFDGGGVSPDVKVDATRGNNISYALVVQQIIFDYATKFTIENPKIGPASGFQVTDETYADFKNFVAQQKDFTYKSKTQEAFKTLKETASKEDYYNTAKNEFDALEKLIALDVQKDMDLFKDEITDLLALEIVKRYYYQKGAYEYSIKTDAELNKALELFSSQQNNTYYGLLSGKITSHAGDKRLAK
ncbi:MAG: S41 family peptidase [Breznakibacter sp.]